MPPLTYGLISLPMLGGVDTRTDPRSIQAPKLTTLLNGRFGKPGTIRKRQGYAKVAELSMYDAPSGASSGAFFDQPISDARAIMTRKDGVFLAASESIYSLSTQRQRWQRIAQVPSARFVYGPRYWTGNGILHGERATTNGVTMAALDILGAVSSLLIIFYGADGSEITRAAIIDAANPRAVIVGNAICLFYTSTSGTHLLSVATFDTAALKTGNPFLFPTAVVANDVNITIRRYDADVSGGRILVAYSTSTANTLKFGYVQPGGALDGAMTTISTAGAPTSVSCAVEPTNRTILVCWGMDSVPRVDGQMFTEAKASLFASAALGTPSGLGSVEGVTCIFQTTAIAEVFIDTLPGSGSASARHNALVQKTIFTTAGIVKLNTIWMQHSVLASKPWVMNGHVYLLLGHASATDGVQRTFFLVASGLFQDPLPMGSVYSDEGYTFGLIFAHPFRPDIVGTSVWLTPTLISRAGLTLTYPGNVSVDYAHVPLAIESGMATYFTGTSLWMLDGRNVVETGFAIFPEEVTGVASATGGGLVGGVGISFSYRVYYEWFSAAGERFLSTNETDVVVPLAAGLDTITLTIPTLAHTNKALVGVAVYRTIANGTIFFRSGVVANDPNAATVSYVDILDDGSIQTKEIDYRSTSELDNIAPPGPGVVCVGNNRVYLARLENQDIIWASKLQDFDTALNFNDTLTIALPPAGGSPVTAMAVLRDSLIVWRAQRIYVVGGDGPNNTGTLGQFDPPRTVSEDVGCISAASVVQIPNGYLFQSRKGIYLLGTDLTLNYVGGDVEAYNGETVTAALALPDNHEVRFTLASGKTLVYHYLQASWSVWSIGGLDAALVGTSYYLLPGSTGKLLRETAGLFTDDGIPYSMIIETPWMHLAGIQGLQRVRRVLVLGDYKGAHLPFVSISYNYEDAYNDRQSWDPALVVGAQLLGGNGGLLGSGKTFGGNDAAGRPSTNVYQFRVFPARPRCQAIKVKIEDMPRPGSAMGESYALSEIAFEVALKNQPFNPGSDRVTS